MEVPLTEQSYYLKKSTSSAIDPFSAFPLNSYYSSWINDIIAITPTAQVDYFYIAHYNTVYSNIVAVSNMLMSTVTEGTDAIPILANGVAFFQENYRYRIGEFNSKSREEIMMERLNLTYWNYDDYHFKFTISNLNTTEGAPNDFSWHDGNKKLRIISYEERSLNTYDI